MNCKQCQNFGHKNFLPIILIFLFTSCMYSAKHIATYTIRNKNAEKDTKELSVEFINQLAERNHLSKDPKYNGIDTIGFFGKPYHYFKFWFEEIDNNLMVKLDYWGNYGSKRNKPYSDLFVELHDFMETNFIILEHEIKEETSSKNRNN
jgi:hypothetical protein